MRSSGKGLQGDAANVPDCVTAAYKRSGARRLGAFVNKLSFRLEFRRTPEVPFQAFVHRGRRHVACVFLPGEDVDTQREQHGVAAYQHPMGSLLKQSVHNRV